MSRFWIGLAMLLCLKAYAAAADEPAKVPQWFPPAVKAPEDRAAQPGPMPAPGASSTVFPRPSARATPPSIAPSLGGRQGHTRVVIRLRNASAVQLAQTINILFSTEQQTARSDEVSRNVAIVPETISNSLIVSGKSECIAEVQRLVNDLDRAAVMIRLEVVMGDVPTANLPVAEAKADAAPIRSTAVGVEEARRSMEILFRAQLTTLDNQMARMQTGRLEPTITSVNMMSGGPATYSSSAMYSSPQRSQPAQPAQPGQPSQPRQPGRSSRPPLTPQQIQQLQQQMQPQMPPMQQSNSVSTQGLGTILTITPRANGDRVVAMQLSVEDSRLAPANEGVPLFVPEKGEPVRSPVVETLNVQTTIKVADGQTVLLSDMSRQAKNGKQRVILVTVHVLPVGDQAKPAR